MDNINLISTFVKPVIPDGFDQAIAFHYKDGDVVLDFLCHKTCAFASEKIDLDLKSPWVDGFKPTDEDWVNIGFMPIYE